MQPSQQLKQTFQMVALIATILVVLIHYRSAETLSNGANGWIQEALTNGFARVAVPLFAFASGFFYFLSAKPTWANYRSKLLTRTRTLAVPYFMVAIWALACWSAMRMLTGQPTGRNVVEIASLLTLHPLAEQLWFIRDLMLLVALAPLIGWLTRRTSGISLLLLAGLWCFEIQPTPIVAGWHLLNIETLLFFAFGGAAVQRAATLERIVRWQPVTIVCAATLWSLLVVARVWIDPDFDLWYTTRYSIASLLLQKAGIVIGCVALFSLASRIESERCLRWAGCSFFVYLIHEFPLREALNRMASRLIGDELQFWIAAPAALTICFSLALLADRWTPWLLAKFTGGRTPGRSLQHTLPSERAVAPVVANPNAKEAIR